MRLTPSNCDDLLFDDVMWVQNARRDHFDFVSKMRDRGVEVVELHNLLTEVLAIPEARQWLLDRKITANEVGLGLLDDTRAFLDALEPRKLAEFMIGGLSTADLPDEFPPLRTPSAYPNNLPVPANPFIGRPREVKELLTASATDLGRERYAQGAGLVDLMRMLATV